MSDRLIDLVIKGVSTGCSYQLRRLSDDRALAWLFAATTEDTGEPVVVKVFKPAADPEGVLRQRLAADGRQLVAIRAEHITHVLDFGTFRDGQGSTYPFLVLEELPGRNLEALLEQTGRRHTFRELLPIAYQIALGLDEASANGIKSHGDLRPANVRLTTAGRVKLMGFDGLESIQGLFKTSLERAVDSPHYLAPEQIDDAAAIDMRADIYAFGVIFYEMLTGRRPFEGTASEVFFKHFHQPPPPLERPELSAVTLARLQAIIHRCLEKNRRDRYQHPTALVKAIAGLLSEQDMAEEVVKVPSRPAVAAPAGPSTVRRWLPRLLGLGLLVLACFFSAIVIGGALRNRGEATPTPAALGAATTLAMTATATNSPTPTDTPETPTPTLTATPTTAAPTPSETPPVATPNLPFLNQVNALAIADQLWVARPGRLAIYDGFAWSIFTAADGLPRGTLTVAAVEPGGGVWLGSSEGLGYFDGGSWSIYTTATVPLPSNAITAIAIGSTNNDHWFGTEQGLVRFDGTNWSSFHVPLLLSEEVTAIELDPNAGIWVGTAQGLNSFNGTSWQSYQQADGLPADRVTALALGSGLWVGTPQGLAFFDGSNWQTFTIESGLADNEITALAADPGGLLWVGTAAGLSRFDGTNWITYTTADGLLSNTITSLALESSGNLWVGSAGGLNRFDGTNWTVYEIPN